MTNGAGVHALGRDAGRPLTLGCSEPLRVDLQFPRPIRRFKCGMPRMGEKAHRRCDLVLCRMPCLRFRENV